MFQEIRDILIGRIVRDTYRYADAHLAWTEFDFVRIFMHSMDNFQNETRKKKKLRKIMQKYRNIHLFCLIITASACIWRAGAQCAYIMASQSL